MDFQRKRGLYEKYVKRLLDIVCSLFAILIFGWLYVIIAFAVRIKMGSPVIFKQARPGFVKNGKEQIFYMYKFRSMTDERDAEGNLLPDEQRLTSFGAWLRKTSLDELPEVFNILKGDMSIIGPRPQLVRDMVFMSDEQRMRHTARPGLSGLAQVKGRNAITWEEKFDLDLEYIENVNFIDDVKIFFKTIIVALIKFEGVTDGINATSLDYGDVLLRDGLITTDYYNCCQEEAVNILKEYKKSEF